MGPWAIVRTVWCWVVGGTTLTTQRELGNTYINPGLKGRQQ